MNYIFRSSVRKEDIVELKVGKESYACFIRRKLTPSSRVLKQIIVFLINLQFPGILWDLYFHYMFTRARHLSPPELDESSRCSSVLFEIHFNIILVKRPFVGLTALLP